MRAALRLAAGLAATLSLDGAAAASAAPDVRLEPATLVYGPMLPQESESKSLAVHNDGDAPLTVGEITVDLAAVILGAQSPEIPPGTVIPAGQHRSITVTFQATAPGSFAATITVPTDDPDEAEATCALTAQVLEPPAIQVSPASFDETLEASVIAHRDLTIRNVGASALDWSIAVLPGVVGGRGIDLAGVNILWDRSHGQSSSTAWSTAVASLTNAGATLTEITGSPGTITSGLLANYQLYWTIDVGSDWLSAERTAIAEWVAGGGAVLITGDNLQSISRYTALLASIGAGFEFSTVSATSQSVTTVIEPHETTTGIDRLYLGVGARTLVNVMSPAVILARETDGDVVAAASRVGAGRVVGLSDELFDDVAIQEAQSVAADNSLFGRQIVEWLAANLWLDPETSTGSTAAGDSTVVALAFDTNGLNGGSFDATVRITSNDSVTPTVHVPAHLTVIGVPDIRVSPTSVSFGAVLVGEAAIDTVIVANDGYQLLDVTSVTTSDPRFDVSIASFLVAEGDSQAVVVSFAPDSAVAVTGTMTIESNDPDESSYVVSLSGGGQLNCDSPCPSPWIRPASIQGSVGATFALDVLIDANPSPISAFGLSITYDPCFLEFADSVAVGGLTAKFAGISAAEDDSAAGLVRVGGFGTTPVPAGSAGSIARVYFQVTAECIADSTFDFILGGLADDVVGMNACCSEFRLTECPTGDGDVNADLALTPQDALCALKIFVEGQNVPNDPDCDVSGECELSAADADCSGSVTPADALAIFERFLDGDGPQPCFDQAVRGGGVSGSIAWGGVHRTDGGEWVASIVATSATRAAGFEIEFDAEHVTFVRAERGVSAETSPAFEVREMAAGRLRGGFVDAAGVVGEVVRLVFRAGGGAAGARGLRIASVADVSLAGDAAVAMEALPAHVLEGIERITPNPSRGSVTIVFAVERAEGARLRILDVGGREVFASVPAGAGSNRLLWDGRDSSGRPVASGVYFVELAAATGVFREKVVLLR